MKPKKTNNRKGQTIVVLILDTYYTYIKYGYPKDPNIYRIRASSGTLNSLYQFEKHVQTRDFKTDNSRFMGFITEVDDSLPVGHVVFGPETVTIEWSN